MSDPEQIIQNNPQISYILNQGQSEVQPIVLYQNNPYNHEE